MIRFYRYVRIKLESSFTRHLCFRLPDMFFVKQKLTIQVAHVDSIKVDLKREESSV